MRQAIDVFIAASQNMYAVMPVEHGAIRLRFQAMLLPGCERLYQSFGGEFFERSQLRQA
jgi:hypothetical protein